MWTTHYHAVIKQADSNTFVKALALRKHYMYMYVYDWLCDHYVLLMLDSLTCLLDPPVSYTHLTLPTIYSV